MQGNSYSTEACKYLADNLIGKCTALRGLDISNMFTTRDKTIVPGAIKVMLNAAIGHKHLRELKLAHNAVGITGISALADFLGQAKALEVFDITNCGLSAEAGVELAKALEKCKSMHLREFYASRQ